MTAETTIYETSDGPRAKQIVETVDAVEPAFVAFVRNCATHCQDPTFPQTGQRGPKERGQWANSDGSITYMQQVEEFDDAGRGIRMIRLIKHAAPGEPKEGALRMIAVGLPNNARLELRWEMVVSATEVRGTSLEIAVDGAGRDKCIAAFREWSGSTALKA